MSSVEESLYRARASHLDHLMRLERMAFAAKLRAARAVLGVSQDELAHQIGLTQKSVHRIESGDVQPKARTIRMIEQFWDQHGISFEDLSNGGFRLVIESSVLATLADPHGHSGMSQN
jgi:DNA-binding XRE family transcriptional regulator